MNELLIEFEEGIVVMTIGLTVVFCFLTILVFAMSIMSKVIGFINKIFPEVVVVPAGAAKKANVSDDEAIALAIAVAHARG